MKSSLTNSKQSLANRVKRAFLRPHRPSTSSRRVNNSVVSSSSSSSTSSSSQ
jgi:hypothetical protein